MKGKITKTRIIVISICFVLALLVNLLFWNAWFAYFATIVCFCFALFFPLIPVYSKNVATKCVSWVLFACLLTSSIVFFRSDSKVSFVANAYRSYNCFVSHTYNLFTGQVRWGNPDRKSSEKYDFDSWKPPKGYTQEQIDLPNARGYLLKNEKGNHEKVVYYIHGGAYISKYQKWYNDITMRCSVANEDSDVFALDYRTAPEDVYPCALNDAVDGYKKLLSLGYQPQNIVVGGDSAGGGLASALTMYLRDHDYPMFSKLFLSSPWVDLTQSGKSYQENIVTDPTFGAYKKEWLPFPAIEAYYAEGGEITDPYISPIFGTFQGFPKTLIIAGSNEILLSDSQEMAKKMKEEGQDVTYFEKYGMWHCYFISFPWCRESAEAWGIVQNFLNN